MCHWFVKSISAATFERDRAYFLMSFTNKLKIKLLFENFYLASFLEDCSLSPPSSRLHSFIRRKKKILRNPELERAEQSR